MLKTPPDAVTGKWVLASANGWSHLITMPGITTDTLDNFLADMAATIAMRNSHEANTRSNR